MSQSRKVVVTDNLIQVAKDIIAFILTAHTSYDDQVKHQKKLLKIVADATEKYLSTYYKVAVLSQLEALFKSYQRAPELLATAKEIQKTSPDNTIKFLEIFTDLMHTGRFTSTSANSYILDEFIKHLIQYQSIEQDTRFHNFGWSEESAKMAVRVALHDTFVREADIAVKQYIKVRDATTKIMKPEISQDVKKIHIDENFAQKLIQARTLNVKEKDVGTVLMDRRVLKETTISVATKLDLDSSKFKNVVSVLTGRAIFKETKKSAPTKLNLDASKFKSVVSVLTGRAVFKETKKSAPAPLNLDAFKNIKDCISLKSEALTLKKAVNLDVDLKQIAEEKRLINDDSNSFKTAKQNLFAFFQNKHNSLRTAQVIENVKVEDEPSDLELLFTLPVMK